MDHNFITVFKRLTRYLAGPNYYQVIIIFSLYQRFLIFFVPWNPLRISCNLLTPSQKKSIYMHEIEWVRRLTVWRGASRRVAQSAWHLIVMYFCNNYTTYCKRLGSQNALLTLLTWDLYFRGPEDDSERVEICHSEIALYVTKLLCFSLIRCTLYIYSEWDLLK